MIDNYLQQQDYHPWDRVYCHPLSNSSIFLGDLKAAENLNFIHHQQIATVITAALGMDHLDYAQYQLKHIVYPLLDHKGQNIGQFFDQFYQIIEKQLKVGHVLVHCSAGISRSSTLVLSYLMRREKWSFKQACQFVRRSRPQILPNLGFERQLKNYQLQLKEQRALTPRKNGCYTSGAAKRGIKSIQYDELTQVHPPQLSLRPMRSSPEVKVGKNSPSKKLDFNIRAIKMRTFQSRNKFRRKARLMADNNLNCVSNLSIKNTMVSNCKDLSQQKSYLESNLMGEKLNSREKPRTLNVDVLRMQLSSRFPRRTMGRRVQQGRRGV